MILATYIEALQPDNRAKEHYFKARRGWKNLQHRRYTANTITKTYNRS